MRNLVRRIVRRLPLKPAVSNAYMADYTVDPGEAENRLAAASTDLERIFYGNGGRVVHKWEHYLPIYERYFEPYRGRPFKMLEIGVFKGGSLDMWRRWFGPSATLFGIDINPACADHVGPPNEVRIGSQDDPDFLRAVVDEMGGLDVVLDDGSHIGRHQRASYETLFPLLSEGGLYVIEDTHTSYWGGFFEGGFRKRGTAIEFAKDLVDDMHGWYHPECPKTTAMEQVRAVSFFDSIIVIEKQKKTRPGHIQIGSI